MHNTTSSQSRFSRLTFFIAFLLLISYSASAQFYTKHYIAPAPWQYFSKSNEIVIATNSDTPVTITVARSNSTVETTLSAVKGNPAIYRFSLLAKNLPMYALNTVINGAGLIVTSTGPTSVNMRNVASDDKSGDNNDAYLKGNAALTSFGDAGLGIRFRVGYYRDGSLGNFNNYGDQRPIYSIMATVDNTTVKINNAVTTTLNAGQSYLFKAPIGTLVESSSPAVMNTSAAIDTPDGCGDSAYNQIPPESVLGTEYFIERGKGNNTAEKTTIVATKDNTNLVIDTYSPSGVLTATTNYTLTTAGSFYTFNNGSLDTPFSASRVSANNKIVVYSGTAQSCEVDISTIAPVSECGGSNFIETAKFRDYGTGSLPYFGYILLRSKTDEVKVNGTNIETITGIAARHQLGTTGWYLINFEDTQINSPNVLSISSASKMTVSIVQQGGGFSMAGFFSNFAAQPEDPTLTYIAGGGCTNNTAALTTLPNFAPYQWYYNGTAISGATSSTYTATKTGNYTVSWTLACGAQTQSKPISVTLCTDLGITKTVDNAKPCVGSNVEFTVKVSNLGGNNVSGVSVNDLLPSGYTFVSATPSVGNYDSATGIWSIGDVDAQTSVTLKITATVKSSGNYTNTASLPASIDTNTANNSASAAVNPNPVVTLVTNPITVCSPATGDLTAAAVTAGSSSNLTFSYYTNATATTVYPNPTSAIAGTYYIKAVSAEGCSVVKSVVVTVNPKPSAPVINVNADSATCGNSGSIVLKAVDNAAFYGGSTYLWSNGATTQSVTINADGVYSLKIVSSSGCTSDSSNPITVTVKPAIPTASDQSFCASENKTVGDLIATGSSLKWYDAATNGTQYAVNTPLTARTYYVSQTGTNGCESSRKAVKVTISSSSAPVASAQTYCAVENKTFDDLVATGSNLKWYSAATGGTKYKGTDTVVSGNYYVSQTANSCGESARTLVQVTINDIPSAPTASSQVFCATDGKTVSNLIATGSNLKWYSASSGGTLYDGTETLSTKNYYVSQSNSCGESPRTALAVTVNTTAAPTAPAQSFCLPDAKKVNNLVVTTGTNLKWYNASAGGTAYGGTETLATGTYYVTQTLNNCESPRTAVSVTVYNTPVPTANSQTFCAGDAKKVNDLVVTSGTNLKWYSASSGGTAFNGTEILSSANYYVSQTLNNCESSRILVSVTVNPTPATPSISAGSSTTLCAGGNVVLTSTSGIGYLWSNGATTQSITVSTPGSYSVQVTNASGCVSAPSAPVNVTVNTIPSTPTVNVTNNCNGTSTLTTSATGTLLWSTGETTSSITVSTAGTYSVTQTINGCTSASGSGIAAPKTTPSTPVVNVTNNCNGTSTLTTSAAGALLWSTGETTSSITVNTPGTYTVTQTVNGCTSLAGSGIAAPKSTPSTPTVNVTNNCNGTSTLTTSAAGALLWSTGETTSSITVSTAGTYTVTQTVNGCTSLAGSGTAAPKSTPSAPVVNVTNNCNGTSTLTTSATGTLLWSTGETTSSITVSTAGTYTVTQTVNGCTSLAGSGIAAPKSTPSTPTVNVTNNCNGTSTLTTSAAGALLWSTGETTSSITVSTAGTYTVTQTVNGCTSASGSGIAAPKSTPSTPIVNVTNNCNGTSTLTTSAAGTLLWSTGETTSSITVNTPGTYTVTQTVNGCTSASGSGIAAPKTTPSTPTVNVSNNCDGTSNLTTSATGTLLWSTGETTSSITVSTAGTYSVTQTVNGCTSAAGSGTAAPKSTPSTPTVNVTNNCDGTSTLTTSAAGTLLWSTGETTSSITVSTVGTYSVTQTVNGCTSALGSGTAAPKTVPSAPVASSQTFCFADAKTINDLIATGSGLKWYNALANGTLYAGTDILATGSYYVSQTLDNCESPRTLVNVTVNSKPAKVITTATICSGDTYKWSVNSTAYTTAGTYTVSNSGCTADQELQLTVINVSSPIVGLITQPTCTSSTASVVLSGLPAGTWTINPGNISGNAASTTITGLTAGNTYNYTVTDDQGCKSTASSDVKIVNYICAQDDFPAVINGAAGGAISTVFVNDKINGSSFLPADVTVSTSTLPTGIVFNADGTITVAPNTLAGTYSITYTICMSADSSVCDSATVKIVIERPVIDAVTETTTAINSNTGGTTISLTANDTLNGTPVTVGTGAGQVDFTLISTLPAGLTLNADKTITVAPGTASGNYEVEYTICDNDHALNCDTVKSYIQVVGDVLVANADNPASVTVSYQPQTIISVVDNDTRNGQPLTASEVKITTTVPDASGYLTLDPSTGIATLGANAPAGTYTLTYSICDKTNASNCSTASVSLTVNAPIVIPVIDAVTETTTAINSNTGGTTISLTANDTLNGTPVTVGTGAG
ncbi:Ig-like domain-containing protein, partial [Flavobacterium daemonense]